MSLKIRNVIILGIFVFFYIDHFGQVNNRNFRFQSITSKDGLPGKQIKDIIQDSLGFIWIGTDEGLVRYDGYEFKLIQDTLNHSEFPIFCMTLDHYGRIWIGSRMKGIAVYNPVFNSFKYFKHINEDSTSLPLNDVTALHTDKNGKIWVGTPYGLSEFVEKNQSFKNYKCKGLMFHIASDPKENILWCVTHYNGLLEFNKNTKNFTSYAFQHKNNNVHMISCAFYNDNLLLVGSRYGLLFFDKTKKAFIKIYEVEKDNPCSISGNDMFLSKVKVDSKKRIWVGTNNDGLNLMDIENSCFYKFKLDELNSESINSNHIRVIFEDRQGLIWIGTGKGINIYNPYLDYIQVYNKYEGSQGKAISGNNISALFEDSKNRIWVGTIGSGLSVIDKNDNVSNYVHSGKKEGEICSNDITSISEDLYGRIWIMNNYGTPKSIFFPDKKIFKNLYDYFNLSKFIPEYSTEMDNVVYSDRKGNMWLGGHDAHYYDVKSNQFKIFSLQLPDSLRKKIKYIVEIFEDSKGNIWLGSFNKGITIFSPQKQSFEFMSHKDNIPNSISSNNITGIQEDRKGRIWISTSFGLNLFNPSTKKIFYFNVNNGLLTNNINDILYDGYHYLWIATNKGLSRMDIRNNTFLHLDDTDGLPSSEINTLLFSSDRFLYAGSTNGLIKLNPNAIKTNSIAPKIVLTDIKVFNQSINTKINISYLKKIELSYKESVFTIDFSAINFFATQKNQYEYKLEGLNEKWIKLGPKHSVTFSGLPPGKYTLWVKASNNHNIWSEPVNLLELNIIPPWWKTTWFYLISFVISVFIVTFYIKYRERNLQLRKIYLENKVKEATHQIILEKEKLEEANQIIIEQKKLVDEKNKNILDSITYARRIQHAILPGDKKWYSLLPQSFLIYLPKDIVAGDFYWIEETNTHIFVAIADCTGHGVPGALMSVICSNALSKTVNEFKTFDTNNILNLSREFIIEQLSKNEQDVRDGMDICLIRIDKENRRKIQYSGANLPLYILQKNNDINDNSLTIIKPDKQPIGKYEFQHSFQLHEFNFNTPSYIYLITDGFADQFGGDYGKKMGNKKLRELLEKLYGMPLDKQKNAILNTFIVWKTDEEQTDDITVACIYIA
ncbi:MAG: SpoIIE family protein phosphatase [Bacteroidia bacterium]|nr:SpoIIE family protein phosphatase [Bacteroidia bacterium]